MSKPFDLQEIGRVLNIGILENISTITCGRGNKKPLPRLQNESATLQNIKDGF